MTILDFAQKVLAEFEAGQRAYIAALEHASARKAEEDAANPFVVDLRRRLYALSQNTSLPNGTRNRAFVYWKKSEPYLDRKLTGWPMAETDMRPEYPEAFAEPLDSVSDDVWGVREFREGVQAHRCGWLYRVETWVNAVEKRGGASDDI